MIGIAETGHILSSDFRMKQSTAGLYTFLKYSLLALQMGHL